MRVTEVAAGEHSVEVAIHSAHFLLARVCPTLGGEVDDDQACIVPHLHPHTPLPPLLLLTFFFAFANCHTARPLPRLLLALLLWRFPEDKKLPPKKPRVGGIAVRNSSKHMLRIIGSFDR